ncbi:related to NAF1 - nuclear assembly factor [Melanopsichium pennsylvanicum]|uniref:H/ACA ribonucleoprotein complex non-core subunit NAF1 n=2 Tax=Melanopsichium pennsylvanicum TaxID=63383 RepID=A0AAJ5C5X1_9BASI|nr:related to NAF1 - nuclear assembly factor [Melanopsichium pennsylvanicum]
MSEVDADQQLVSTAVVSQGASGVPPASSSEDNKVFDSSKAQDTINFGELAKEAKQGSAAQSASSEEDVETTDLSRPTEASVTTEATATTSHAAASRTLEPFVSQTEEQENSVVEVKTSAETNKQDSDFVQPDIEHIVSTGATQDGASSMQALRELVAQARASTGQQREALPPGFGDDDSEREAVPTQAPRGEKRKAEAELEELVQSSAGIDEVKAAAEESQHPETKTLLQKALSSLSGLVSRKSKAESNAATPSETKPEQSNADGADVVSSDDSDSDSESASSSGNSSDDEDEEDEPAQSGLVLADDDDEEPGGSTVPATKNEILAPDVEQPAIQEVTEAEKATLRKLGKVHSIVDSVVVVEQDVTKPEPGPANANAVPVDSAGRQGEREGEYSVLDTGSLLCFEDGKVLGLVFETFGSIHNPMYSIRFASAAAIDRDVVEKGKAVYYLPAQSTYVLTQLLRQMKGSDASNIWDEEVAEDEIDYSDDEQEAEAKRRAKAIRSGKVDDHGNPIGSARTNKRQKNVPGHSSQPPHGTANGTPYNPNQRPFKSNFGPGQSTFQQRPSHTPASLPQRSSAAPNLPRPPAPPAPAGPAALGPAFPHGMASLPPKPSAGLPSRPSFQPEAASSSNHSSGNVILDSTVASTPRLRMGTSEGLPKLPTAALPAKPVDAAAAAAAAAKAAATGTATGAVGSSYRSAGAASPPQPTRPTVIGRPTPTAHPHQGSPGWYPASGSAPSSTPASPAAPGRGSAYSPGANAPHTTSGGGHYNPAYAGHWQQPPSQHAAWNAPQGYHPAPLHMAPGQQPYGGYVSTPQYGGGYGGAQPPNAIAWTNQSYPGSHYPGYIDASTASQHRYGAAPNSSSTGQGHYNPSAQAYGFGTYPSAAVMHATPIGSANPSAQDSYDPRSPSMGSGSNQQQQR